jgi:hypothetical protein
MYASIYLSMFLFCYQHCVLTGIMFSQVGFICHSGKINTAFNMHFVITVGLRIVVDIVFQFHCKECVDMDQK